ncbi:hypothetical protein [Edaphobacter aggregans]|uniref:hypothetical protein n=1 Tax=Edaphobacter aggregans TaxID=570835 RepID=UPI0012FACA1E|nr:hypothetical protein [Edaphobacter aggregans]
MLTALILLIVISVFATLAFYASRNVLVGWYCLLATYALGVAFGSQQTVVGSLHLDPSDAVSLILLAAGLIRFSRVMNKPGFFRVVGLCFILVFAFSLIRGMLLFGVVAASNEGRSYIGELLSLLYFATIPTDEGTIKKFVKAYLIFGCVLVGIAILHYLGLNVGSSYEALVDSVGDIDKNRAVPAAAAMAIALCFIFSVGWITHQRSPRFFAYLPVVFGGMVVLLQHRTIWVALLICALSTPFVDRAMAGRLIPIGILAGILAFFMAIWVYGTNSSATEQFEDSSTNLGTWGYRVDTWDGVLFDDDATILSILAGKPVGTPTLHFDAYLGSYVEMPAHSEYIFLYQRVGVFGLTLFLIFLLRPVSLLCTQRFRHSSLLFPSSSSWCLASIAIFVYGVTYNFNANAIPFIGVATALLLSPEHSSNNVAVIRSEQSP